MSEDDCCKYKSNKLISFKNFKFPKDTKSCVYNTNLDPTVWHILTFDQLSEKQISFEVKKSKIKFIRIHCFGAGCSVLGDYKFIN